MKHKAFELYWIIKTSVSTLTVQLVPFTLSFFNHVYKQFLMFERLQYQTLACGVGLTTSQFQTNSRTLSIDCVRQDLFKTTRVCEWSEINLHLNGLGRLLNKLPFILENM